MSALGLMIPALISCTAIDGDTLRCGSEPVRLIGIDAPELPGHCRRGRDCVPGDPHVSHRALQRMVARRPVRVVPLGRDAYGRTIAAVSAGRSDLSCAMVRRGYATYIARWDWHGKVARCLRR